MRCWIVGGMLAVVGCTHDASRQLDRSSKQLARAVGRGDASAVEAMIAPGMRARLDREELERRGDDWSDALKDPIAVEPTAVVFVSPEFPVDVVETPAGWRFAEDPTDVYANDTPRHALRALVWASRAQRWDVVLRLAPTRYRMGLSEDDLRIAWTEGEYANVLTSARDAVAAHLADAIIADAHEATLAISPTHRVYLEREGDQWVVVDFVGAAATNPDS